MQPFRLRRLLAGSFLGGLLAVACHQQSSAPPNAPSAQASAPAAAPVAAAIPLCVLPRGQGSGEGCEREDPHFLLEVERSIDRLAHEHPDIFDLGNVSAGPGTYQVRDVGRYVEGMVANVRAEGACVLWDGEELAVKRSNDFNDQFDILTAENFVRRDTGCYRATCRPAWF